MHEETQSPQGDEPNGETPAEPETVLPGETPAEGGAETEPGDAAESES